MSTPIAKAIAATRDLLLKEGWTQCTDWDEVTGARCMGGALDAVASRVAFAREVGNFLDECVQDLAYREWGEDRYWDYVVWNDRYGRTLAEIIYFLDDAEDSAIGAGL